MTFCDMEVLYRHAKCVLNWKFAFPTHLTLIENLHLKKRGPKLASGGGGVKTYVNKR